MEAITFNNSEIDKLCEQIGVEGTAKVLSFALPRIIQFEVDICQAMQQGDYPAASRCAHKAVSSVRTYGTKRLENLLREAIDSHHNQRSGLQQELSDEFALVIGRAQAWLQGHS